MGDDPAQARSVPAGFRGFDPQIVARFDGNDVARLLADPGIVRSRAKIEATIGNARAYLAMEAAGESFSTFVWSMAGGAPIRNAGIVPTSDSALGEDVGGAQETGLQVRRSGHRLRVDAGHGHRERSCRRLLSPRRVRAPLSAHAGSRPPPLHPECDPRDAASRARACGWAGSSSSVRR